MKINNEKFYSWLLGFFDAESNFQITKEKRINKQEIITSTALKYAFHIGLHERDKNLLELIQSALAGKGKIYEYLNKREVHYAIYDKEGLHYLIEHVLSKYPLLTKRQINRYDQLKIGVLNNTNNINLLNALDKILVEEIDINARINNNSQFYVDHWIVGFLNGEVSFTRNKTRHNKIIPRISLEHTDEGAIKFIHNRLNLNTKIYSRSRDTRKTTYTIHINSIKDIKNTINFLDEINSLKGYKLLQYQEWKKEFNL